MSYLALGKAGVLRDQIELVVEIFQCSDKLAVTTEGVVDRVADDAVKTDASAEIPVELAEFVVENGDAVHGEVLRRERNYHFVHRKQDRLLQTRHTGGEVKDGQIKSDRRELLDQLLEDERFVVEPRLRVLLEWTNPEMVDTKLSTIVEGENHGRN